MKQFNSQNWDPRMYVVQW